MKKVLIALLLVIVLVALTSGTALAVGDKVRGEKSEGPSYQIQDQDPPPFQ